MLLKVFVRQQYLLYDEAFALAVLSESAECSLLLQLSNRIL